MIAAARGHAGGVGGDHPVVVFRARREVREAQLDFAFPRGYRQNDIGDRCVAAVIGVGAVFDVGTSGARFRGDRGVDGRSVGVDLTDELAADFRQALGENCLVAPAREKFVAVLRDEAEVVGISLFEPRDGRRDRDGIAAADRVPLVAGGEIAVCESRPPFEATIGGRDAVRVDGAFEQSGRRRGRRRFRFHGRNGNPRPMFVDLDLVPLIHVDVVRGAVNRNRVAPADGEFLQGFRCVGFELVDRVAAAKIAAVDNVDSIGRGIDGERMDPRGGRG